MTNSLTSDAREKRLKDVRDNRRNFYGGMGQLTSDFDFLLSMIDHQAAGDLQPLTNVIAEIAAREGVLDGWYEEVVLLTPDERDDIAREWRALQEQINKFRQQFELLDDPQGLYSATKSEVENSAATRMRDKCVEKLTETLDSLVIELPPDADSYLRGQGWNSALQRVKNEVVPVLQSLTLDNGDTDAQSNG